MNSINTSLPDPFNYNSFFKIRCWGKDLEVGGMVSVYLQEDFNKYPTAKNVITTTFQYDLPNESKVEVGIYNLLGEKIAELVNTIQQAGRYEVKWNAENFASGIYIYQLKAGDFISSKKFILLK